MPSVLAAFLCSISLGHCPPPKPAVVTPPAPTPAPAPAPAPASDPTAITGAQAWIAAGRQALEAAQKPVNTEIRARNLILFLGDGMGMSTVTAARILEGQNKGLPGEENRLAFENFPATALAKTYNTDLQVPEAAGTMSAIMTGVKTRGGSVAMDETPEQGACASGFGHETATLLEKAKDAGLAAGLVSTSRITLAVPAATYAHVSDHDWEFDGWMPAQAKVEGCRDIARQLVEFDHRGSLDIVLGGGRLAFMPLNQADPQQRWRRGVRGDRMDLIANWSARNPKGRYVWSAGQLAAAAVVRGPILGLFAPDNLASVTDHAAQGPDEPSLADMTQAAIAKLAQSPRGFVLVVHAGGIDAAHHDGNAARALAETIALSDAVRAAAAMTTPQETLILVTADHSHTLSLGGYPRRGAPILGLATGADDKPLLDDHGRPYTTLTYANGRGSPLASSHGALRTLTADEVSHADYVQRAAIPLLAETHAGEDVPVYASGPGAQWVHGTLEQNVLYWIMRSALGPPIDASPPPPSTTPAPP